MDSHPASFDPSNDNERQAQDAQFYRGVLHELIGMGMDLARLVHAEAGTGGAPDEGSAASPAAAAVAFDRIARTIRRTIALARRLDEPVQERTGTGTGPGREAARRQILRGVEDAIQREAGPRDGERLQAELHERMDGPDLDDDIGQRPVAEIIAEICRDLGLLAPKGTHPWKRRTPDDIVALCARAAARPNLRELGMPEMGARRPWFAERPPDD